MTIKELYDWAREHKAENCVFGIDCEGFTDVSSYTIFCDTPKYEELDIGKFSETPLDNNSYVPAVWINIKGEID